MKYTIDIPDNIALKLINRVCLRFGYQDSIMNESYDENLPQSETNQIEVPNPENKIQFAKRMNIMWLKKINEQGAIKELLAEIKGELKDL
jgi:hypothetical protein